MKRNHLFLHCLPALLLAMTSLHALAQVKLDFDMGQRGPLIGKDHYGIFYEEINHAGDGGLYAELVRNRSFEEDAGTPAFWSVVGSGRISLDAKHLLNRHQGHSLCLVANVATTGIRNDGYWGMKFVSGETYDLSFWVMCEEDKDCKFQAELQTADGTACGRATIKTALEAGKWQKVTATVKATKAAQGGKLCLKPGVKGTFYFDVVSLFPPTFKGRKNGCRADLAQMLYDLKPGFMRFPGGCYIEGLWANGKDNRFEWKKTIGPIEERPGHRNQNWGYNITDGQGYHEYLELCEDLGASAMFVVNMGWGHDWQVSIDDIGPYIQEALDAVEYALGDTTTVYGRMRARNGHPEPFDLKYLEIGNENEWFENYPGRYAEFYKAIKARWPQLHLIADGSWNNAFPAELGDEHYYTSPEWFVSQYHKYDSYSRSRAKVYVGEYAVTQNPGRYGNLSAAIGEAVFMQGMENNSDVCVMGSYAPIFANENAVAWHPDMIRFNANMSYGTPSYYVQKLFANNVGKQNIKWTETDNVPPADEAQASFGIGTWATAATFSDIEVKAGGVTVSGAATGTSDWTAHGGRWTQNGTTFRQTDTSAQPAYYTYNTPFDTKNMTYTLKATKNSGAEGFLILIDYRDEQNYTWWNIGGWGNSKHGIERCTGGAKQLVTDKAGSLETGHEYTIRIVKEDTRCRCYLDGELIHEFTTGGTSDQAIYTSASIDDEAGKLYVKLVNPNSKAAPATLSFRNGRVTDASLEVLTSARGTDENTTSAPNAVIPRKGSVKVNTDGTITYEVPAFSVNVLVLTVADVNIPEEHVILSEPVVSYSFNSGEAADDSGRYPASLEGAAAIMPTADGGYALYTGALGGKGYLDMGTKMAKEVLAQLDDYSVSIDILLGVNNTTGNFCWGYALANGTSQYIGLVNAGGNGNWYYELKNSSTQNLRSNSGLNPTVWHNLTYTQHNGVGQFYIDGKQLATLTQVTVTPKSIASAVKSAWLARSPFGGDAYLENAYIDNFSIYATALSPEQVAVLGTRANGMPTPGQVFEGLSDMQDFRNLVLEVKNYVNACDDDELKTAYTAAARLLKSTNGTAVANAKKKLEQEVERYTTAQLERAAQGGITLEADPVDLTFLLRNSSFTLGPTHWIGADMPFSPQNGKNGVVGGYVNETAEQFSRTFDIWQELSGLPAGYYILTASAFYRAGTIAAAWKAKDDYTPSLAEIYLNDTAVPVAGLYDRETTYTYQPYTYPDNLAEASKALNGSDQAYENAVAVQLAEGELLRCGIRKLSTITSDWTAYDNFRLLYLGPEALHVGVRQVGADTPVLRSEYVWPDGIRTSQARHGVNILRETHADGGISTRKIYRH